MSSTNRDAVPAARFHNALPRFLDASRRAMIAALVSRVGYGLIEVSRAMDVSPEYARWALRIIDDAPELADAVVAGGVSVADAYAVRRQPFAVRYRALQDVLGLRERTLVDSVKTRSVRRPARHGPAGPVFCRTC